jgi:hypothetical protein
MEMIKKNHYDYLLTDIKMPRMDGITLIKEVRKLNQISPIKIFCMTGAIIEDLPNNQNSTKEEEHRSAWEEEKRCFGYCTPFMQNSTKDRIVVEDRGGDDSKRFLYFREELGCSFLTRIQCGTRSRRLHPLRNGEVEEVVSVQMIAADCKKEAGAVRQWRNKKLKKTLISKIAFREVRLPDRPAMPLFLVCLFTEGFGEPMTILTDIAVRSHEDAWRIFFWYKKRWEVENFFRAIKQEFGAEQFLVRTLPKIRGLAFVQVLAFSLLLKMKEALKEIGETIVLLFRFFCHREQRKKQSHLDLLHFLRQTLAGAYTEESYRFCSGTLGRRALCKPKYQLRLFPVREKW